MIHIKNFKFILLTLFLNLFIILFIYQSVFKLEFEGDSWHYGWGHKIYYGHNVFSPESLKGMRSSLGGASLTFGLIENNFGLNAIVFYTISVILKFLTVVAFFFLVRKLTNNNFASLVASLILSATFAGIEATHWVFNMYAYIGLIFITISILTGLDLPTNFKFKRWLLSYALACVGVWYATMRTNGIIPLIIAWSFYKFITLRSKSSKINLIFWILGFVVFIVIDKFLLGQMETDYSRHYIIGEGLRAFQIQITNGKYDFLLSSASNIGSVILPDITWYSFNFPKIFSFLGSGTFRLVILPSILVFTLVSWILSSSLTKDKKVNIWVSPKFILIFSFGFFWTLIVYFISTLGPLNFSSWVNLVLTLFGGYFMVLCIFLVIEHEIQASLKDLFFLALLWSFVFLLLPLFQNGGAIFGTQHRYMVTTAPAVPIFMAGLLTLSFLYKNNLFRVLTLLIAVLMLFTHASSTKAFLDRKAMVHNKILSAKIWQQFTQIVPNKYEYVKNLPTIFFISADNQLDRETLFETLHFGFLFQASIKYGWNPHAEGGGIYYENYPDLVKDIKKNPALLDDFYAIGLRNQSLINMTEQMKQKIASDIQ